MKVTKIIKANGEEVPFDFNKLEASLRHSGATKNIAKRIAIKVESTLYKGMHTKEIYKKAFALLKKIDRPKAARYHLKKGIQELGPSGFPFEKYISEILKFEGYKIKTNQIVAGYCLNHEIDVIAEKDNTVLQIECKFHNQPGFKCNVKIPLYIHSRFRDVQKKWEKLPEYNTKIYQAWVVTNTKFTEDAIKYGNCTSMYLLSWNYPQNGSLKEQIDASGLYPITCLTTLTKREKQLLLEQKIVLCKDICTDSGVLISIGLKGLRLRNILKEAKALCNIQKIKLESETKTSMIRKG